MSDYDDWDGELLSSGKGFKRQQREQELNQDKTESDSDKHIELVSQPVSESWLE